MSSVTTPSSTRDSSPESHDSAQDPLAAVKLAQLEALLQSRFLSAELDPVSPKPRPAKRAKITHESGDTSEGNIAQPSEQVAFRLFSNQKTPQVISLVVAGDIWPTVPDPRIRDVDDEPDDVIRERRARIVSCAVAGSFVKKTARRMPRDTRYAKRVTTRTLVTQDGPAVAQAGSRADPQAPASVKAMNHVNNLAAGLSANSSSPQPFLAYLDAAPPTMPFSSKLPNPESANGGTIQTITADTANSGRSASHGASLPPLILRPIVLASPDTSTQAPTRPPRPPRKIRKKLQRKEHVKQLKAERAAQPSPPAPGKGANGGRGNVRLSKARREIIKAKMAKALGKNAKKNKRKKAKMKAKQQQQQVGAT